MALYGGESAKPAAAPKKTNGGGQNISTDLPHNLGQELNLPFTEQTNIVRTQDNQKGER